MGGVGKAVGGIVNSVLSPVGKILGGGSDTTVVQQSEEAMPTADSDQVTMAKRRKTAEQMQRSGRASTILGGGDRLGG